MTNYLKGQRSCTAHSLADIFGSKKPLQTSWRGPSKSAAVAPDILLRQEKINYRIRIMLQNNPRLHLSDQFIFSIIPKN